jgi:hypothetical protein
MQAQSLDYKMFTGYLISNYMQNRGFKTKEKLRHMCAAKSS